MVVYSLDAIESSLIDKTEWESHCDHLFSKTGKSSKLSNRISRPNLRPLLLVSQGAGQVSYGKSTNVGGYLPYGNGSSNGSAYDVIQNLTASKPAAVVSGYSLSDSQHEQDSLSEDEEDHDGN